MEREQGLSIICAAVAESLGLDPQEVRPGSRLVTDLGATSLDIIDVVFTLERRFEVKFRNSELDALLRGELFPPSAVVDGRLRPEALQEVARFIPAVAELPDQTAITPQEVVSLVTVESLWSVVERQLAAVVAGRHGGDRSI